MAKKKKPIVEAATEKQLNSFEKEYALDHDVCSRFLEYYTPKIADARQNRLEMEDQWLSDHRLWSCRLDDMGYVGRSNIFVPELHAQVELSVDKAMSALFPSPELIAAVGINGTPQEKADKIRNAVDYELMEKAKIYVKHQEFERTKILLGTAVYKGGFRKELKDVYTRDKDGKIIKDQIPKYFGVTWDVVDMFRWYIYPETGNLLDNEFIFEDQWYPRYLCEEMDLKNLDQVSESTFDKEHNWVDAERLEIVNISSAASSRKDHVFLTEVWTEFALNGKDRVPVRAVLGNDGVVLSLKRNGFWFQSHPYLADNYIQRPGKMFYGFSLPDKIRSQQYQINDLNNHTMDSLSYSMNPITVIDPGLAGDINSMKMSPGARWFGAVEGVKMLAFPDLSAGGLRAIQEIRGQIAQFSDTQPGIAPQLQGKARSATQAAIINDNVSQRQRSQAKTEEANVLSRMCQITHSNLKQFMDKDWQIKYQGADAGEWIVENLTPSDIWGEAEWIWLGASAVEKSAVRSQQLLAFQQQMLQMATVLGPEEIDLPELVKLVAREGFELRNIDHIFKSVRDKKTVDPDVENIALIVNREVKIHLGDDDDFHIEKHLEIAEDKSLSKEIRMKALEHIQAHEEQKIAKEEIAQAKAQMEAQQRMMQEQEQAPQQDGRAGPAVPSPMEGNSQQVPEMGNLLTGVKGVNPAG
jgi:hypothetical protein